MLRNNILQPKLKDLVEIVKDKSKGKEIVKKKFREILNNQIPDMVQQELDVLTYEGSLLDNLVAYNRVSDIDIHLTYHDERLKRGKEIIKSKDDNDRKYLQQLYNDVEKEGNFFNLLKSSLEKRGRIITQVLDPNYESTWRRVVLLQSQLGYEPKKNFGKGHPAKLLERRINDYIKDVRKGSEGKESFRNNVLRCLSNIIEGREYKDDFMQYLLELSIGEDRIYHEIRQKAKYLLDREKERLLFQKSEHGFPYFLNLFCGQEEKAIIKLGIDPTNPELHLGNTVPLNVLKEFQNLGYYVTIVLGDRTATIGDPSGKISKRKRLSPEEIAENVKTYKQQILKILDRDKTNFVYNSTWLKKLEADQSMDDLKSQVDINKLLARKDFQIRMKKEKSPSLLEVEYALYQGADSLSLGSYAEVGGWDQLINMMVGRDIQDKYKVETQLLIFTPLLLGIKGKEKMSKSLKNYIAVNEPPEETYKKIMLLSDYMVYKYYQLLTNIDHIFSDIKLEDRKDLFTAFGGLNLLVEHGNKIVSEENILLNAKNNKILEKIEKGNGDGKRKKDQYCKSTDCELLKEIIFDIESNVTHIGKERYGITYGKPSYRIITDPKEKEPFKIKGLGYKNEKTIETLFSYEKANKGTYDPRNLKERLAMYIIKTYHGEKGLEAIKEEMKKKEEGKYINLDSYFNEESGHLKWSELSRNEFKTHPNDLKQMVNSGSVTLDGEIIKDLNLTFEPGKEYKMIIGKKTYALGWGK